MLDSHSDMSLDLAGCSGLHAFAIAMNEQLNDVIQRLHRAEKRIADMTEYIACLNRNCVYVDLDMQPERDQWESATNDVALRLRAGLEALGPLVVDAYLGCTADTSEVTLYAELLPSSPAVDDDTAAAVALVQFRAAVQKVIPLRRNDFEACCVMRYHKYVHMVEDNQKVVHVMGVGALGHFCTSSA